MNAVDQKKLALIERLLAKAESTTPEEAEALTEAAEKLMIRHGIDEAMVAAKRAQDGEEAIEGVAEDFIEFTGVYAYAMRQLCAAVGASIPTIRILRTGRQNYERIYIIGFESDVARTKTLLHSLSVQGMAAMRAWWAAKEGKHLIIGKGQQLARREFLIGFAVGAASRLAEKYAEATAATVGSEIALLDRGQKADEFIHDRYKVRAAITQRRAASRHGWSEGVSAGEQADIGDSRLS